MIVSAELAKIVVERFPISQLALRMFFRGKLKSDFAHTRWLGTCVVRNYRPCLGDIFIILLTFLVAARLLPPDAGSFLAAEGASLVGGGRLLKVRVSFKLPDDCGASEFVLKPGGSLSDRRARICTWALSSHCSEIF